MIEPPHHQLINSAVDHVLATHTVKIFVAFLTDLLEVLLRKTAEVSFGFSSGSDLCHVIGSCAVVYAASVAQRQRKSTTAIYDNTPAEPDPDLDTPADPDTCSCGPAVDRLAAQPVNSNPVGIITAIFIVRYSQRVQVLYSVSAQSQPKVRINCICV